MSSLIAQCPLVFQQLFDLNMYPLVVFTFLRSSPTDCLGSHHHHHQTNYLRGEDIFKTNLDKIQTGGCEEIDLNIFIEVVMMLERR